MSAPASEEFRQAPPAGFWLRAGAYVIDLLLVLAVQFVIQGLSLIGLPGGLVGLLTFAVPAVYFTWMPVRFSGQTAGKMAAGLAVGRPDGSWMTYPRALGRWAGYLISSLPLGLGFLAALFTPEKKALHDFIVDTRVRKVREIERGRKALVVAAGLLPPALLALGLLSAWLVPGLARLEEEAGGGTRTDLNMIRATVSLHFGDSDGSYPEDLSAVVPQYLQALPAARTGSHPPSDQVTHYDARVCSGSDELGEEIVPAALRDTGAWGYVSDPRAPCWGHVFVDCTHADEQGRAWHSY